MSSRPGRRSSTSSERQIDGGEQREEDRDERGVDLVDPRAGREPRARATSSLVVSPVECTLPRAVTPRTRKTRMQRSIGGSTFEGTPRSQARSHQIEPATTRFARISRGRVNPSTRTKAFAAAVKVCGPLAPPSCPRTELKVLLLR